MVELDHLDELAIKASTGDQRALDRLLHDARPLLLGRCRRFLPNEMDAEEAAQDALFSIARNIAKFEHTARFRTWMYRITTNAAIDCYRKLKRRSVEGGELPEQVAAGGSTPSVVVGARIDLLDAAERIDRKLVEPVMLRDLCELSYDEIAELLGVPLGTVKSRIHEGRSVFRREMYGDGSSG